MITSIIATIIVVGLAGFFCYKNYKKCNDDLEKSLYIVFFLTAIVPVVIYYLDRYNIPTCLGWSRNVNSQNWLSFLANYSTGIISATISAVVLVFVTILQIKKNREDNIERDKDNLRVQNMPILKYSIDTENKSQGSIEECIETNVKDGNLYNLNISIKNVGLNNIKNIKVDFCSSLINNSVCRIWGNKSIEVLERQECIKINRFFSLNSSKEPYNFRIIVYYEDVLSNWYKQVLELNYSATNISNNGYIGIVKYVVNKENQIDENAMK